MRSGAGQAGRHVPGGRTTRRLWYNDLTRPYCQLRRNEREEAAQANKQQGRPLRRGHGPRTEVGSEDPGTDRPRQVRVRQGRVAGAGKAAEGHCRHPLGAKAKASRVLAAGVLRATAVRREADSGRLRHRIEGQRKEGTRSRATLPLVPEISLSKVCGLLGSAKTRDQMRGQLGALYTSLSSERR